ncbi:rhomboid family intramembrane serine protease [Promicromonospora citrea]|uniref:Rhomboid family intramembrane serine protease n=1 Tax=Promicromonospora citrea TaxID=43677 RepID=A0A8H9L3B0_9MICO|nr:rhomboid family intramembrane serine protease [Promicromonospora citrea]NNH50725.1 rhomboid family intramembrane serine protease [Promicromonospora citrea]GGM11813.1 rhomboid family intramembrane serine protease [Promicromonospora citrea]
MNDPAAEEPTEAAPPVCPRHPDRVAYVRCQRCGRPACPECQRPAAVGVQCVDCVRESRRTAPRARTVFGGVVGGTTTAARPVVTFTIIGICVVSWILQLVTGGRWTELLWFWPWGGAVEPWRFLTASFLHSTSPLHILFNMYALWITGQFLEPLLGRLRFTVLCLLAAVGGQVAVLLLAGDPYTSSAWVTPVVGASGMVFGLFGAMLPVLRRLGRSLGQVLVLLAINGAIGFFVPRISWQAHLGGLVVGALVAVAYAYAPRERRALVAWLVPVVGVAVLVALAVGRYSSLGVLGM